MSSYWQVKNQLKPVSALGQWANFYWYFYQLFLNQLNGRGWALQYVQYTQLCRRYLYPMFRYSLPASSITKRSQRIKPKATRNLHMSILSWPRKGGGVIKSRPILETRHEAFRFFPLYLTLLHGLSKPFVVHAAFKDMFIMDTSYRLSFASIPKLITRWRKTHNMLLNLFYAQAPILAFTHKALRDEALAFNWSFNRLSYAIFKYAAPYFFLKNLPHGDMVNFIFRRFDKENLSIAFISDIHYHRHTAFHLRKSNFYTLGIVPISINPWLVQYPIMVGSCTLFTQYFFLQLLLNLRGQAEYYTFMKWVDYWI